MSPCAAFNLKLSVIPGNLSTFTSLFSIMLEECVYGLSRHGDFICILTGNVSLSKYNSYGKYIAN